MTIKAKIVDRDGNIEDVQIEDDPTDPAISKALGGSGEERRTEIATIGQWEIHAIDKDDSLLLVGSSPDISDHPKRRKSCDFSDDIVRQIATNIRNAFNAIDRDNSQ